MSVEQADQIDAAGNDDGTLVLVINDHLGWDDEQNHVLLLKEKIDTYITIISEGLYKEIFLDEKFETFRIEIYFDDAYTLTTERLLTAYNNDLKEHRISVVAINKMTLDKHLR